MIAERPAGRRGHREESLGPGTQHSPQAPTQPESTPLDPTRGGGLCTPLGRALPLPASCSVAAQIQPDSVAPSGVLTLSPQGHWGTLPGPGLLCAAPPGSALDPHHIQASRFCPRALEAELSGCSLGPPTPVWLWGLDVQRAAQELGPGPGEGLAEGAQSFQPPTPSGAPPENSWCPHQWPWQPVCKVSGRVCERTWDVHLWVCSRPLKLGPGCSPPGVFSASLCRADSPVTDLGGEGQGDLTDPAPHLTGASTAQREALRGPDLSAGGPLWLTTISQRPGGRWLCEWSTCVLFTWPQGRQDASNLELPLWGQLPRRAPWPATDLARTKHQGRASSL